MRGLTRACAGLLVVMVVFAAGAAAKGAGPTSIAAGYGSVWIGTGTGDVVALSSSLGRTKRVVAGGPTEFVHAMTAEYGAVWVLRDRLTRLAPGSNAARDIPGTASTTAFALAAGARAIWIADDGSNEIVRVDPGHLTVQARISVPGRAWGVAAGDRDVIVVSVPKGGLVTGPGGIRELRRIDPSTNHLSPPLARANCDVGVAIGAHAVWTFDACTGLLARRDSRTLQVVRKIRTHVLSQAPALGFGSLWLASRGGVLRIDPVTLRTRTRISARSLVVAIGSGSVWALDSGGGRRSPTIRRIDPETNRVVEMTRIPLPRQPR